jgi:exonuclease SbcC
MKETQQKIIETLHMDYDTFTNSALLRQSHADEFTVANPAKRKQVLANILGLSFYDELETQAKDRVSVLETETKLLESNIKDISDELAGKTVSEAELTGALEELYFLETEIEVRDKRVATLREEMTFLQDDERELSRLEEHQPNTRRQLEHWQDQIKQYRSLLKDHEELIARRTEIEEYYNLFTETEKLNAELNQRFRDRARLNERKHELEMNIEKAQATVLGEHKLAQREIDELEARSRDLSRLQNESLQLQQQVNKLIEMEEALDRCQRQNEELRGQLHELKSGRNQLEQEIAKIEERLGLLTTQEGAKCPLCETELGSQGITLIESKYRSEKESKIRLLGQLQGEIARKESELGLLDRDTLGLRDRLSADRAEIQGKTSLLQQAISQAETAENVLDEARKELSRIEQSLMTRDFCQNERATLAVIEDDLSKLDYNEANHRDVRTRLSKLESYRELKRRLEEALRLGEQERAALESAEQIYGELNLELVTAGEKSEELINKLKKLPQLTDELAGQEREQQKLMANQKQVQEKVWAVKLRLAQYTDLEKRKTEKTAQLAQFSREEHVYRDLAQAFGKRGIQAMLIEIACPEIEAHANQLLARMTDNRMHLRIETQRQTKKGDTQETLDINISDELGTRSYEMYSGGEAFRINFAIRIALSRLLAGRVGAPLPTLIIDEGFGTQDDAGIEKIKDAINSIQDDFDLILVITHIEELRDAFPNRINVVKRANGSVLEVS